MKIKSLVFLIIMGVLCSTAAFAQNKPYRVGTTAANFLEMGIGSAGCAMGEAQVGVTHDLTSVYWNPAGLAYMTMSEIQFAYQPWIAGIDLSFGGVAFNLPQYGTFALSYTGMNFGRTEVTTMEMQEGTGETYAAMEMAVGLSYARKLAEWFGFGTSIKYIRSSIWHMSASAAALDLGVIVDTPFFSPDGNRENGLSIGMSISNYGTRMKYDGMDLLQPIDISPDESGNFKDVAGQYRLQSWELPLIFRVGVALTALNDTHSRLTLAADALHPNNNSESINFGGEYRLTLPGMAKFFLRTGYHGIFMENSEYGLTFGGGIHWALINNKELKIDYAYKSMGLLGYYSMFTVGVTF
jgi:hypothetical protein